MSSPPLNELTALSKRLSDVACILHEMAYDDGQVVIRGIVKVARKVTLGKAIHAAARRCRSLADQRFRDRLRTLENAGYIKITKKFVGYKNRSTLEKAFEELLKG